MPGQVTRVRDRASNRHQMITLSKSPIIGLQNHGRQLTRPAAWLGRKFHRAFSLVELMVVIAVAVLLTSLLMPAMHQLHENARRVMCMSNLQQLGDAFLMYGNDYNDRLPYSAILHQPNPAPQELMASMRSGPTGGWDGMGLLYSEHYCEIAECFYCPSHHGNHPYERYADLWSSTVNTSIYTNYHYCGDIDWANPTRRRSMLDGHSLVLATDGLRTAQDFNHILGMNMLRADGSVRWREDNKHLLDQLPTDDGDPTSNDYVNLWGTVVETPQ